MPEIPPTAAPRVPALAGGTSGDRRVWPANPEQSHRRPADGGGVRQDSARRGRTVRRGAALAPHSGRFQPRRSHGTLTVLQLLCRCPCPLCGGAYTLVRRVCLCVCSTAGGQVVHPYPRGQSLGTQTHIHGHTQGHTYNHGHSHIQSDRHTDRQTDRHTDRHTDKIGRASCRERVSSPV